MIRKESDYGKRKIIMDCDPGVDDAIALAYAAAHPEAFELLAVTSVTGNQTIDKVTRNALDLVSPLQAFYSCGKRGRNSPAERSAAGI